MDIQGKIIVALPEVSGVSKAGNPWKKREYVLETQETYPKKVFFDFFGERADQNPLQVGDLITLSFDIESREYMGKWYTSIRGYRATKLDATPAGQPQAAPGFPPAGFNTPATGMPPVAPPPTIAPADNDDLPF